MFKVGDRVIAMRSCGVFYPNGALGTVVSLGTFDLYVNFDKVEGVSVKGDGSSEWWLHCDYARLTPTEAPAARSNDPATSKGKRRVNKYEQAVLEIVGRNPAHGVTGKDIAKLSGFQLNCITPRFAPLRRKGLIKDSGLRRDKQIVWVLA